MKEAEFKNSTEKEKEVNGNKETKVIGGCYKSKKLHRIRILTIEDQLLKEWQEAPEIEEVHNGWVKKKFAVRKGKKRIVFGMVRSNGWRTTQSGLIAFEKEKCLEIWIADSVLAKKLIGDKRIPRGISCPGCS